MKLSRIRIENYKSIEDVNFEINEDVSVIVGPNDHGKTNILMAILDAFTFPYKDENEISDTSFYKRRKRRDSGATPLRISFFITNLPKGLRHTKKKLDSIALSIHFMAKGTFRCFINSNDLTRPKRKHSKSAWTKYLAIRSNLNVIYVPTFRNLETHLQEFHEQAALYNLISTHLLGMLETQQGGTTAEYRTINSLYEKIEKLVTRSFEEIEDQVSHYMPSSSKVLVNFGFLNNGKESADKYLSRLIAKEVFVKNKNDGTRVSDLGSGIQQAVLIGLLEKNLIKNNKTNVILFEEPESFLHPSAQRELFLKLSKLTKRPSTHAIFSTHSAAVVDSANLKSLIVIKKNSKSGITKVFPFKYIKNSTFGDKDFSKLELEKTFQNSEIFFSDLVVFVEGRSDQLVLREVIKQKYPELSYRITIIDIGGSGSVDVFANFISCFRNEDGKAFKWIAILDKDSLFGTKALENAYKKIHGDSEINWSDIYKHAQTKIPTLATVLNENTCRLLRNRINNKLKDKNFYINAADVEYLLVNENNYVFIKNFLIQNFPEYKSDLNILATCNDIAKLLGSKGPNLDWKPTENIKRNWKKPFIAKAIIANLSLEKYSEELNAIIENLKDRLEE